MATSVDLGGDTLYVTDVYINNTTPGTLAGVSVASVLGTSAEKLVVTSTSANALAVGANGTTNPVFDVNANTTSVATGIQVTGAAATAGVAVKAISSTTNESVTFDAKGTGTITLNGTATGATVIGNGLTITDNTNVVFGSTTGSQIGTATTQKLGFYGAPPVVQQAAITTLATTANSTTISVAVNAIINELIALGLIA